MFKLLEPFICSRLVRNESGRASVYLNNETITDPLLERWVDQRVYVCQIGFKYFFRQLKQAPASEPTVGDLICIVDRTPPPVNVEALVGETYVHMKTRNLYIVTAVAKNVTNIGMGEFMVIYRRNGDHDMFFARDREEFCDGRFQLYREVSCRT